MPFVSAEKLAAQSARIDALENSKRAFLARLEAAPESFEAIAPVSNVTRDGVFTTFDLDGDVARVTIDAIGDRVVVQPVRHAKHFNPVVIDLRNDTLEVDFDYVSATELFDVYRSFRDGPGPSVADLASGLNRHVAG